MTAAPLSCGRLSAAAAAIVPSSPHRVDAAPPLSPLAYVVRSGIEIQRVTKMSSRLRTVYLDLMLYRTSTQVSA